MFDQMMTIFLSPYDDQESPLHTYLMPGFSGTHNTALWLAFMKTNGKCRGRKPVAQSCEELRVPTGHAFKNRRNGLKRFLSPGTVVPQHNLVSFNAIYNNIKE